MSWNKKGHLISAKYEMGFWNLEENEQESKEQEDANVPSRDYIKILSFLTNYKNKNKKRLNHMTKIGLLIITIWKSFIGLSIKFYFLLN